MISSAGGYKYKEMHGKLVLSVSYKLTAIWAPTKKKSVCWQFSEIFSITSGWRNDGIKW